MYRVSQGHEHLGPGTSMVQRINWTGAQEQEMRGFSGFQFPGAEFASDCMAVSGTCAEGMMRGLGCGCKGKCGKGCGLGFFDGGMDVSTWGPLEWGAVALGGYMVLSTVFTTGRAVRRVRALPDDVRAGVRRGRRRIGQRIAGR